MNADEREEIAASIAAHAELGPKYESAVAEGLVERIGEEIDRRVDARLRGMGHVSPPRQASSPGLRTVLQQYHGQRAASGPGAAPAGTPAAPPAPPVPPAPPSEPARRGNGVTGMFLGLGSLGLAVGATAVVVSNEHSSPAAVVMILLIWAVIAIINVAHSQRR